MSFSARQILTDYWKPRITGQGTLRDERWALRAMIDALGVKRPDDPRELFRLYRASPAFFMMHVLGAVPWISLDHPTRDQLGIIETAIRKARVAVRSGHKVSKSHSLACLALYWFTTRAGARVAQTSSSFFQVRQILWHELKLQYRAAALRGIPLGGKLYEDPNTGLSLPDGRQVFGFSTAEPERAAGISGRNVFYMPDEASGIAEVIFEAIEGNRAGGARILMTSNPTRTSGYFYDAFHGKRQFWTTIHIPSTHSPNVAAGRALVPGLATPDWIEEKRQEWGESSPIYQVRVSGEFPSQSACAIFSLSLIEEARERGLPLPLKAPWEIAAIGAGSTLSIGVDPSGTGEDPWVIAATLGPVMLPPETGMVGSGKLIAERVLAYAKRWRDQNLVPSGDEIPVMIDANGEGWATHEALTGRYRDQCRALKLRVRAVVVSEKAYEEAVYYDKRTEIAFTFREWLRTGTLWPDLSRLEGELAAAEYDPFQRGGKFRIIPKKIERKNLGRSPNFRDAYGLSVYHTRKARARSGTHAATAPRASGALARSYLSG